MTAVQARVGRTSPRRGWWPRGRPRRRRARRCSSSGAHGGEVATAKARVIARRRGAARRRTSSSPPRAGQAQRKPATCSRASRARVERVADVSTRALSSETSGARRCQGNRADAQLVDDRRRAPPARGGSAGRAAAGARGAGPRWPRRARRPPGCERRGSIAPSARAPPRSKEPAPARRTTPSKRAVLR